MKRNNFILTTLSILTVFLLISCQTTKHDYQINYLDYETRENNTFDSELLITEDNFISTMEDQVEPYLNQRLTSGYLDCKSGNTIYYETLTADNPKGVIVIFHGFREFGEKYNEHSYYFLKSGYSVVRFDHHGHGKSTRIVDNASMITTENFQYYVDDADDIIQNIAVPLAQDLPLFCYAHSMGGGIATYYMEQHPTVFTKAVLNCPMIGVNCGKFGEPLTNLIANTMVAVGKGHTYIPGNHDYVEPEDLTVPSKAGETISPWRRLYYKRLASRDVHYQTSGATYSWTKQSVNATKKIRSRKMASKLQTPILLLQSQNDVWVASKMQNKIRSYSDVITLAYYPELEHDMFSSKDMYLYEYYNQVLSFFAE